MNMLVKTPKGLSGQLTRRRFIISTSVVGGSFVLGVSVAPGAKAAATPDKISELNPYIIIAPDDTITIQVTMTDIGNGVITQACMNIAEELNCDWSKIKTEFASMNRNYREQGVYSAPLGPMAVVAFGSGRSTTPLRLQVLLQAGASARERLKAAAAAQWKVPVTEIEAANSVLIHTPTGRKLRYGEVAAQAATIKLAREPAPKPSEQWTILGKQSPVKTTVPAIVNGSAVYGMDVRLPGMVYAALRQAPVFGGKIKSVNADAVRHMPGVRGVVIVDPTEPRKHYAETEGIFPKGFSDVQWAVAVIADHYWQARKALDALPLEWDDGPGTQWKSDEHIAQAALAACDKDGEVQHSVGKALDVVDKQAKLVEASYYTPYCDHCVMEPLNGTALVTADRVDAWLPTQMASLAFYTVASETGVDPANIYVHPTYIGGGFGRRGGNDDTRMVIAVAKKFPGTPVHVIWSREETMRQGRYRTATAAKFKAGLDKDGMPVALVAQFAAKGVRPTDVKNGYTLSGIPNVHIVARDTTDHIPYGPYRGPNYNSHAFIVESFIDECAHAAGIDPLEYRLKLLAKWPDPGWAKCLKEVAEKSGWGKTFPKGRGQGIAISNWGSYGQPKGGTTVACVATVEVTRAGQLIVEQLDVAFDCGDVLNHDGALAQMQGGTIFGLNMTLNEGLSIKDGHIVEGNFDNYPIVRIADAPKINVYFGALTGDKRYTETGEPPVGPVGPAITNAIFRATGKRIRTTPLRKQDLKWA